MIHSKLLLIMCFLHISLLSSCSTGRSFWSYVVGGKVAKPLGERQQGEVAKPRMLSPHNVKVVYNDGSTSTEVLIPILSSGQQIVVDHDERKSPESLSVIAPPPTPADQAIEKNYINDGHQISSQAVPISILKTHEKMRELASSGNYYLALEYAQKLLQRYPNHVKTLRAKGSLYLKIGEKKAALESYYRAEEIESDPEVRAQIKNIEKSLEQ